MKILSVPLFLIFSFNYVISQKYNEDESEIEDEIDQERSVLNYENVKYPNYIYGLSHLFPTKASNKDLQLIKRNSNNCY